MPSDINSLDLIILMELLSIPDEETIRQALNTVTLGSISQNRKLLREKALELKNVEKTLESMAKINLPVNDEVTEKVDTLRKEVKQLEKVIPTSPQVKKGTE